MITGCPVRSQLLLFPSGNTLLLTLRTLTTVWELPALTLLMQERLPKFLVWSRFRLAMLFLVGVLLMGPGLSLTCGGLSTDDSGGMLLWLARLLVTWCVLTVVMVVW